jgi:MSHA biogenesis protein MshP
MSRRLRQRGMSLVVAIFLITVIASLAAFAVTVGTATRETSNLQLQADRAQAAAHAGIEWGTYQALVKGLCVANLPPIDLTERALNGFRVTVTCTAQSAAPFTVYEINALAQWSNFGAANYASRRVIRHVW